MALSSAARVILAHQVMLGQVRDRVKAYAANRWTALGSYRDADIERFVAAVVPIVEAGQKQTAQLTVAYLDSLARMSGFAPAGAATPITGDVIRGVAMAEVYKRPGVTVWTALSEGKLLADAVSLGGTRADQLIDMDLQLAQTHNARDWLGRAVGVVGYMRVLGGGNNCALCALASTQRYHRSNLMPIHERCHCSVVSLYGNEDPGQVINIERYGALRQQLEDANAAHPGLGAGSVWEKSNKPNSHIRVNMHGEYGPTLTWRDQAFTGPATLNPRATTAVVAHGNDWAVHARVGDKKIGSAYFGWRADDRRVGLSAVDVAVEAQGRGYGSQLIDAAIRSARSKYPGKVLEVEALNPRVVQAFRNRGGFQPFKDVPEVWRIQL